MLNYGTVPVVVASALDSKPKAKQLDNKQKPLKVT